MPAGLTEQELQAIERKLDAATQAVPEPWKLFMEARAGIGGCSFIRGGDEEGDDREIHLDVHLGSARR